LGNACRVATTKDYRISFQYATNLRGRHGADAQIDVFLMLRERGDFRLVLILITGFAFGVLQVGNESQFGGPAHFADAFPWDEGGRWNWVVAQHEDAANCGGRLAVRCCCSWHEISENVPMCGIESRFELSKVSLWKTAQCGPEFDVNSSAHCWS
jgi:hypothetical protein